MPIVVEHQPPMGVIAGAAYAGGLGQYNKWLSDYMQKGVDEYSQLATQASIATAGNETHASTASADNATRAALQTQNLGYQSMKDVYDRQQQAALQARSQDFQAQQLQYEAQQRAANLSGGYRNEAQHSQYEAAAQAQRLQQEAAIQRQRDLMQNQQALGMQQNEFSNRFGITQYTTQAEAERQAKQLGYESAAQMFNAAHTERMQQAGFGQQTGMQQAEFGHATGMQQAQFQNARQMQQATLENEKLMQQNQFGQQLGMYGLESQDRRAMAETQYGHQMNLRKMEEEAIRNRDWQRLWLMDQSRLRSLQTRYPAANLDTVPQQYSPTQQYAPPPVDPLYYDDSYMRGSLSY